MEQLDDSSDRPTVDYVMFALAFVGFMTALCAVVVAAPGIAVAGALVLLVAMFSFPLRAWLNEV